MVNASGKWIDEEVVVDDNVITSRSPEDLPMFMRAVTERLQQTHASSGSDIAAS